MTEPERLRGYGHTCLNVGVVLCVSWIPALGLLQGLGWATPDAAKYSHWGALLFAAVAPLFYGARVLAAAGDDSGEVLREWAKKCLRPALLFATGTQLAVGFVEHVSVPVILTLMAGMIPLGIYGVLLLREAAAVE